MTNRCSLQGSNVRMFRFDKVYHCMTLWQLIEQHGNGVQRGKKLMKRQKTGPKLFQMKKACSLDPLQNCPIIPPVMFPRYPEIKLSFCRYCSLIKIIPDCFYSWSQRQKQSLVWKIAFSCKKSQNLSKFLRVLIVKVLKTKKFKLPLIVSYGTSLAKIHGAWPL